MTAKVGRVMEDNLSHLWKFFPELGLGDDGSLITYIIAGVASYDGPYSRTKERIISMVKPHLGGRKTAKMLLRLLKAAQRTARLLKSTKVWSVIHHATLTTFTVWEEREYTPTSSYGTA